MKSEIKKERAWELDFFRGIALILMIYFHIIYDMKEFFNLPVEYLSGFNYLTGKGAVILFMLISGISCTFSRSNIKRGLRILALAVIITIGSHLFNPGYGIKFGVLHFFAAAMLLYPLLEKAKVPYLLALGALLIYPGYYIYRIPVTFDYLFPFGVYSNSFISSDYYPLIPWLGIFIFGIVIGKLLYKQKKSIFRFTIRENPISIAGRHTLLIYMLHQPIILLLMYGVKALIK